jgi:hypothetical protein
LQQLVARSHHGELGMAFGMEGMILDDFEFHEWHLQGDSQGVDAVNADVWVHSGRLMD